MLNGTESIRPLRDRVLVKELPWRNKTATGIHLPDQAQKKDETWRALVVAVGPGRAQPALLRRIAKWMRLAALPNGERDPRLPFFADGDELTVELDECIAHGFGADVKPGDVVLVSKYVHSKIGYGAETLCCIAASDILGVVEGDANDVRSALETALARLDAAGFGGADAA